MTGLDRFVRGGKPKIASSAVSERNELTDIIPLERPSMIWCKKEKRYSYIKCDGHIDKV